MIISAKARGFQNATAASADMTFRQPREALKPDGFTLEGAEQWALEQTSSLSADRFRLTSFWYIDYIRQHVPGERKTRYIARLAQSENYGIAFGLTVALQDTEHALALQDADRSLVGDDSREILKDRRYRTDVDRAALIDLVIGHSPATENDQVMLDQTLRDKHALRARLFAHETEIIMRRKGSDAIKGREPHVLVIGATAGVIGALVTRGFKVAATDMSEDIIGGNLGGVTVRGETENASLIEEADLVIITGMTLPTRALPSLIERAKISNASTMMWAITGKNFGSYYVEQGVDCVVSDPSPFLLLPGRASIEVWRRRA
jgi:Putative heavy-metal chelation